MLEKGSAAEGKSISPAFVNVPQYPIGPPHEIPYSSATFLSCFLAGAAYALQLFKGTASPEPIPFVSELQFQINNLKFHSHVQSHIPASPPTRRSDFSCPWTIRVTEGLFQRGHLLVRIERDRGRYTR
jgi:hypothetical protein